MAEFQEKFTTDEASFSNPRPPPPHPPQFVNMSSEHPDGLSHHSSTRDAPKPTLKDIMIANSNRSDLVSDLESMTAGIIDFVPPPHGYSTNFPTGMDSSSGFFTPQQMASSFYKPVLPFINQSMGSLATGSNSPFNGNTEFSTHQQMANSRPQVVLPSFNSIQEAFSQSSDPDSGSLFIDELSAIQNIANSSYQTDLPSINNDNNAVSSSLSASGSGSFYDVDFSTPQQMESSGYTSITPFSNNDIVAFSPTSASHAGSIFDNGFPTPQYMANQRHQNSLPSINETSLATGMDIDNGGFLSAEYSPSASSFNTSFSAPRQSVTSKHQAIFHSINKNADSFPPGLFLPEAGPFPLSLTTSPPKPAEVQNTDKAAERAAQILAADKLPNDGLPQNDTLLSIAMHNPNPTSEEEELMTNALLRGSHNAFGGSDNNMFGSIGDMLDAEYNLRGSTYGYGEYEELGELYPELRTSGDGKKRKDNATKNKTKTHKNADFLSTDFGGGYDTRGFVEIQYPKERREITKLMATVDPKGYGDEMMAFDAGKQRILQNDSSSANYAVTRGDAPPDGAVMMNAPFNGFGSSIMGRVEPVTVAGEEAKRVFLKDATKNLAKQRKKYDRSVEDNMWLM